ncbi:MAG: hypothetical protein WD045_10515, partial [Pirellulaceae bacterium]
SSQLSFHENRVLASDYNDFFDKPPIFTGTGSVFALLNQWTRRGAQFLDILVDLFRGVPYVDLALP